MSRSSPARRSQLNSSPERGYLSPFLHEKRNHEATHLDALAAAQQEHERVRQAAIRVYELHELKEEHDRIVEQERKEQERLKAEAKIAEETRRLQELKAKTIPKPAPPPPEPEPEKVVSPAKTQLPATNHTSLGSPFAPKQTDSAPKEEASPVRPPQTNGIFTTTPKAEPASSVFGSNQPNTSTTPLGFPSKPAQSTPQAQLPQPVLAKPAQPAAQTAAPAAAQDPILQRYVEIHQELKKLRKDLTAASKVPGSPLKGQMGTFRREIRVSIGQLTHGKGANSQPIGKITAALKAALEGQVPSPPIEVSKFVTDNRQPEQGVPNNEPTLPALFIYLMNVCAKGIIAQFINECSANPKAADPIGVFAAHIFSHKEFQWRGKSLIDILMAKFRVVCPVLFGLRGNDRTERGRLNLGWRKDGPSWITEQSHNDRMAGLGAGYASIALRDFSKSSKSNPYPPTHYWRALADIVNSPAGETSNTQYIVVRSMIDGHQNRFITFYGNAAVAALRMALVEFPKKAPEGSAAAGSVTALAEVLRSESGLALA